MDEPLFKRITENTFEAGPSGGSGAISYGTPYGTPQGGNTTQNPVNFTSSDKTVNHFNNQSTGSAALKNRLPGKPNTVPNKSEPSKALGEPAPAAKADQLKSQRPLDPDDAYGPDVDKMFQKKNTPSPDEIMSALQYELSQMVMKDKTIAKRTVLQNLQQDPQYYSRLGMLNIDDKKMKVDEGGFDAPEKIYKDRQGGMDVYFMSMSPDETGDARGGNRHISKETAQKLIQRGARLIDMTKFEENKTTFDKTKSVLDEMIAERQSRMAPPPPNLGEILKDLAEKRRGIKSKE